MGDGGSPAFPTKLSPHPGLAVAAVFSKVESATKGCHSIAHSLSMPPRPSSFDRFCLACLGLLLVERAIGVEPENPRDKLTAISQIKGETNVAYSRPVRIEG